MLAVIYLIALTVAGLAVVQRAVPEAPPMVRIAGGFLFGIVATAWITYAVAFGLSGLTGESLMIGLIVALAVHGVVIGLWGSRLRGSMFRLSLFEIVFIGLALAFSFWLMDNRLFIDHDAPGDPLVVSSETWGDTGLHTALSRSFSWGHNYPTEYPFFANEPIRYHFGYDFFAGALQEGGLSVLLSFNLPGALGFTAMMMLLFSLGRFMFGRTGELRRPWWRQRGVWVGLIAVAVLMTNQSFAFLRYFQDTRQDGGSIWTALKPTSHLAADPNVHGWWNHTRYLTLGPYDNTEPISLFNTLNVYLTQTHLIVGMAAVLFVAFCMVQPLRLGEPLKRDRMLLLGVMFGLSFWLNGVLFITAGVFFGTLLVVFALAGAYRHSTRPEVREAGRQSAEFAREFGRWASDAAWFIVPALALAVPQAIWLSGGGDSDDSIRRHFGYLVCSTVDSACHNNNPQNPEMDLLNLSHWGEFWKYWWLNIGVALPLFGVAVLRGSRSDWKIFFAAMAVFIFGNTFQLSRDLGGHNHKVFNLWEVLTAVFIGYALVELWTLRARANLSPALAILATGAIAFVSVAFPVVWMLTVTEFDSGGNVTGAIVLAALFSGVCMAIASYWTLADGRVGRPLLYGTWAMVPVLFVFLVLSGIFDFMTIKNDFHVSVFGNPNDGTPEAIEWIDEATPEDAVFLTTWGELYTVPTLAGRGVYLGYDPWAASAGYEVAPRQEVIRQVYTAQSKDAACGLLLDADVDYVLIGPAERSGRNFALNESLFANEFTRAGSINNSSGQPAYDIYDVAQTCADAAAVAAR